MRKVLVVSLCLLFVLSSLALARNASQTDPANKQVRIETSGLIDLDLPLDQQGLQATAQADTYVLGEWSFDTLGACDPMGWIAVDRTLQDDCYWHIDDFAGLGGGSYGLLVPIRGLQSLWCGAEPDPNSLFLCGYASLPGYGNGWNQSWVMRCIEVPDTEQVYIDYITTFDSEPGYDGTSIEYATKSTCDSLGVIDNIPSADWTEIGYFDGSAVDSLRSDTIPAGHNGSIKIRFRFHSDGAWSDYDGLWNTDGGAILDSVTVTAQNSGVIDFEDFEDEAPEDKQTAELPIPDWNCQIYTGYSTPNKYAALYPGLSLVQEDPCRTELTCVWAFINGSTETYACGGHPAQFAVPKENERGQFINEEIWSPTFAWTGMGTTAQMVWDVYRDLPIPNLVFYTWSVRSWVDDCPFGWRDRNFVYYGANKDWFRGIQNVGDLIDPNIDSCQVALGCVDMCGVWCSVYGDGDCHSHSPIFDNVLFRRIGTTGPQWSVRDIDMLQDTWPTDGSATGTGRVDMALDRAPAASPTVYVGDSATVTCTDPVDGFATDLYTGYGAAVYCYFSVSPQNQPGKKTPGEWEADAFRWPMVDSVICDGKLWYKFRCDTAFTEPGGPRTGPVPDRFCIDVNDNLIEAGDTLEFFFSADGNVASTYWSQGSGTVTTIEEACEAPMEMQVLPGAGYLRGGDILYVDNFSGRGGQPYFDSAFELMNIDHLVDRYDKRGPSSSVANGLGNRVRNTTNQLINIYRKILWNSGDLSTATVGDGTGSPEKSDDYGMLFFFLDQHTNTTSAGVYFSGDDLAQELAILGGASASNFRDVYMPHVLVTGDHTTAHGISPIAVGTNAGIFDHGAPTEEDTIVAYGGCPIINDFDQIQPIGSSNLEMTYSGSPLSTDGAVISFDSTNALGNPVRVVLSGFSFHYIRDDRPAGIPDRADHLTDIIEFLGNILDDPVGTRPVNKLVYDLRQNYPNPFNPSTRIEYRIKERAHVTLKIYNVAGQLVKTLVNEQQNPRVEAYTVQWRGRNDAGMPVSSGVYFYKLVANNFTQTKKMVLLK
jgi:hypothetical protein